MKGDPMSTITTGIGALAALVAAGFWLWASLAPVSDSIDALVADMQFIAVLNAIAAGATFVAAVCGAVLFGRRFRRPSGG